MDASRIKTEADFGKETVFQYEEIAFHDKNECLAVRVSLSLGHENSEYLVLGLDSSLLIFTNEYLGRLSSLHSLTDPK